MRKLLLAGAMLLAASAAFGEPAYSIANMSCASVQAAVQANGSVVLRWRSRSGMLLYGRYVSDRSGSPVRWQPWSAATLQKATSGKIALSEAQDISELIENRRRVLVAQDLERRLSALENSGRLPG